MDSMAAGVHLFKRGQGSSKRTKTTPLVQSHQNGIVLSVCFVRYACAFSSACTRLLSVRNVLIKQLLFRTVLKWLNVNVFFKIVTILLFPSFSLVIFFFPATRIGEKIKKINRIIFIHIVEYFIK